MAKEKLATDEKFEKQDFDLFEALAAIDRKDYSWYEKLSEDQRKKFVPFMLIHWASAVSGSKDMQSYYVYGFNEIANKYFFNEYVQKHPKLQWLMLCASSPGVGKQFHYWVPQIKSSVISYKEPAKVKDIKEYFTKIYGKIAIDDISMLAEEYVRSNKIKFYLAKEYPELKHSDIETLASLVTDQDIKKYEQERGND